jgi:adenosylmethionine-8-amino-7-oxononanoate aminotransferase
VNLSARDQKVVWHPFTQHQISSLPIPISRGKGAYLFDDANNQYLDLVSSWMVNLHGHGHPEIAKAIYEQALTLEHVIFAGFTHEPAVALAEKIIALLPDHFSKVFFSDNGSTSVEIALKMAYQYWQNIGDTKRKRFVAFEKNYHGDTFGAMSVGKSSGFYAQFSEMLFPVDLLTYPSTWINDDSVYQKESAALEQVQAYLEQYGQEVAAIILEPLVQGSSGMHMCTPRFLQKLEALVRQYQILIIYDEVMTGFGRTGDYFACKKATTQPDIICVAKGLTGGFLPLAATVCSEQIYQAFLGDSFQYALAHGHSFTANPLGCAAALASLAILSRPETQQQIAMIERVHHDELKKIAQLNCVEKLRYCGTIMAFDLKTSSGYGSNLSLSLRQQFLERGLLIRPLGDVIYFLPPFCVTEAELKHAYEIVINEIQGITV